MAQIATYYDKQGDDRELAKDIQNLKNAHNLSEKILELEYRTSDPTGLSTTTGKVFLWYRGDTNQLSAYVNGSTKRVTLS